MSTVMLYRVSGEPERGVKSLLFGPDRIQCEYKIFQVAEKDDARQRGWVDAQAWKDMIANAQSDPSEFPRDDRKALVQWIKESDIEGIDLRQGLDDLVAAVEAHLDANGD